MKYIRKTEFSWDTASYHEEYLPTILDSLSSGASQIALDSLQIGDRKFSLYQSRVISISIGAAVGERDLNLVLDVRGFGEVTLKYVELWQHRIERRGGANSYLPIIVHELTLEDDGCVTHEILFAGDDVWSVSSSDIVVTS